QWVHDGELSLGAGGPGCHLMAERRDARRSRDIVLSRQVGPGILITGVGRRSSDAHTTLEESVRSPSRVQRDIDAVVDVAGLPAEIRRQGDQVVGTQNLKFGRRHIIEATESGAAAVW